MIVQEHYSLKGVVHEGGSVSHQASVQAPQVITAWIQVYYIYMVQT